VVAELDRLPASAATECRRGGVRDSPGQLLVRRLGCQRQVPRSELRVADEPCQLPMELPHLRRGRARAASSGQERMGGADALAVDHEDPVRDRALEHCLVGEPRELGRPQVRVQRDRDQQPSNRRRQPSDPRAEHVLDGVRHRQVLPRGREPVLDEETADLQREQGIADRRLHQLAQHLPGQDQAEPLLQEMPQRTEAERADLEELEAPGAAGVLERRGGSGTPREQEADVVLRETAACEGQRVPRGRIEPMDVVDRDEHGCARRQRPYDMEEAERDRSRLGRHPVGLDAQQSDAQCPPLRRGQHRQRLIADFLEEVDQPRKCEPCLGAARPRREHLQPALPRGGDPRLPQRRLPDSRSADENEAAKARAGRQELANSRELLVTSDWLCLDASNGYQRPPPSRWY
jgi:hypothetical protein